MPNSPTLTSAYLLELGSTPELSWAELDSLFGDKVKRVDTNLAILNQPQETVDQLIDILGGTIKIFQVLDTLPLTTSNQELEIKLLKLLETNQKLKFFVAEINRHHLPAIDLSKIKTHLTEAGQTVRYMAGPRQGLSAAILRHKTGIKELAVINTPEHIYLAQTLAVQDIDDWTKRDRGKPFADRQRGLLTPKVARMMVNLAGSNRQRIIYDPFCGTGTILMEAGILGFERLVGSDLDPDAVTGSSQNLEWLQTNYQITVGINIFPADATKAQPQPIPDVIVTEPFLGKLKPKAHQVPNIVKGLTKLYIGTLKNWHHWLKPGSEVVIIFPRFIEASGPSVYENLIDKFDQLGYTTTLEPIIYARPKAIVQRQIVRLKVKQYT
ncbi:MAG: hypothetical protein ABIJ03_02255 [Patescibacteria group bacterium]